MIDARRRRSGRASAAVLAVLLVGGGCASLSESGGVDTGDTASTAQATETSVATTATSDAPSATESSTTTALAGQAAVDLSDGAQVTVLNAGSEPRVELRTQVEPGQAETMVMVQTQDIRQEVGGQEAPATGPIPLVMELDLVADSTGGSLLTYTSTIASATVGDGVDPALAAQVEANLDPILGISTTAILDDRGRVLTSEIEGLDGLDPTLASTMDQMLTSSQFAHPLPEEAVGVGARWEIEQLLLINGLDVQQVTSYEVLAIDGSTVELATATEQTVEAGSEMVAGGAAATVVSWESISSGAIMLDLTSMVPTGISQLFASQELEFGPGAEKTLLKQTIETRIEISRG